jgi:hypothetical protein
MSTTPTPKSNSVVDTVLALLDSILAAAGSLIPGGQLADLLVKIIQRGVTAYEDHTGKPIDPSLLKPINPIP